MTRLARVVVVGVVAALVASVAPASLAKDGDVIRRGSCSRRSDWKLKLSPENGRIEVEFEVDQNKSGVRWRVALRHDGKRFARTTAVTGGRSGSFEVRRVRPNHGGKDFFRAVARNLRSGEVCRGTASF